MKNQLNQFAARSRVLLQRLVRRFCCFFGHSTSAVTITKQDGYYQWGRCSCGANVERDAHIWSDDPWRKSAKPNAKLGNA